MADKECTVFIVDVGQSMGEKRHGRDKTDLDWSLEYVWDKLGTIIQTNRKTLFTSVMGLRTDGTDHNGPEEEEYDNISVFKHPSQMLMPDVRNLTERLKLSNTDYGDAISAIIVAMDIITTQCKALKYKKQIVLSTNCTGNVDADQLEGIASRLKELNIELLILGVDLDDAEYGFKEEDKDETKRQNEETLKRLASQCDGTIGTLKQAIEEIRVPRIYIPNTTASFKGMLSLGDSETYETAMEINVERYAKIMVKAATSAKKVVTIVEDPAESVGASRDLPGDGQQQTNGDTSLVHINRTYAVKDGNATDGKQDVDENSLAKGYEYGREIVAIDPSDEAAIQMETIAGISIIGFVPRENVARYMDMSKSHTIVSQKTNDLAAMALSSLIHTLYELDTCAIARLVTKDMRPPVIVALTPSIEVDFECLIDVELPFAEDFRQHKFPPLDRIPTFSGKVITEHRNLPSDKLKDAMSAYVDSMDLSRADKNEEGEETDYLKFEDVYSPKVNRISQAIKHRAVHPDDAIPPPLESLIKYSHPPEQILKEARKHLEHLQETADVKKVPPKSLSRRNFRAKKNVEPPRSGLDVGALLSERPAIKERRISPQNAVPEFIQIVGESSGIDDIQILRDAVKQLGNIIKDWIRQSMGDSNYDRVIETLKIMRRECQELDEPAPYNDYIKDLKAAVFKEELGGDRRELWWAIRKEKLGLFDRTESEHVDVEPEEARTFLIPDRTRS